MKIRNGFVSNSSTSNFVILGVKLTKKEFETKFGKFNDDNDPYERIEKMGLFWVTDTNIVGKVITTGHDDGEPFSENSIELDEITAKATKVAKALYVPIKRVKLLTGTMSC